MLTINGRLSQFKNPGERAILHYESSRMHIFASKIPSFETGYRAVTAIGVKTRNCVAAVDRAIVVFVDASFHHAVVGRHSI